MSRFLSQKDDGTYLEEIESMEVCRWRINDVCCNDKSDCLGDYPYPSSICELEEDGRIMLVVALRKKMEKLEAKDEQGNK